VATGTVAHATKGAPPTRLQIEQWQLVSLVGAPSAVYRMKPQKQPPSIICITLSSAANISVHQRRRERHSPSVATPGWTAVARQQPPSVFEM
jgi:hypothetical protein